ncbi:MAG: patatin-like phospholipase family protein [Pseudomonadota bacterium]
MTMLLRPLFFLALLVVALAGCSGHRQNPDAPLVCSEMRFGQEAQGPEIVSQDAPFSPQGSQPQSQSMAQILAQRATGSTQPQPRAVRRATPVPTVRVALFSSGGQWGAFSAGFMNGWSANRSDPRPERFDIVTGVSTGALIAPFVFAGPDYDSALRDLYDGIDERQILRRRAKLELLTAPSLWDPSPLERLVDRNLSPELVERLADDAATRSLLVGAVNLRSGFFEPFDLTAMAASDNPRKTDCLQEGLLASAAIPVAFPPRQISDSAYIDGATRQGLFLEEIAAAGIRADVYVFVNNSVGFPDEDPDIRLTSLVGRSTTIISDELLRQSAIEAVSFAKAQGWRVRGVVAPDLEPGPDCSTRRGGKAAFCASFTKELFRAGFDKASAGPIDWLNADGLIAEMRRQSALARGMDPS